MLSLFQTLCTSEHSTCQTVSNEIEADSGVLMDHGKPGILWEFNFAKKNKSDRTEEMLLIFHESLENAYHNKPENGNREKNS